MQGELLNAAILLRRGSWVDPELFERAAWEIERLKSRIDAITEQTFDADSYASVLRENDALKARVAELEVGDAVHRS